MYQTTASKTSTRAAQDQETGKRFSLPESFPTFEERKVIQMMEIAHDGIDSNVEHLAGTVRDILENGAHVDDETRFAIWQEAEENFLRINGRTWGEAVGLFIMHAKDGSGSPEMILESLTDAQADYLMGAIQRHPFEMRHGEAYKAPFRGACQSRRAGVPLKVWIGRAMARTQAWSGPTAEARKSDFYGFICYVAGKVWSMPVDQLVSR